MDNRTFDDLLATAMSGVPDKAPSSADAPRQKRVDAGRQGRAVQVG